jgi:hypothetical protein
MDYPGKLAGMAAAVHEYGGVWIAPAAPGFDAREIGGERVIERQDGAMLRRQVGAALGSDPDAVGIISWNEFSENSHIEPSCDYGTQDLIVIAALRGGSAPVGLPDCANGVPLTASVPMAPAVPDEVKDDAGQTDPAPERKRPPSRTTIMIEEQIQSDFDSSSPGGTQSSTGGLAVIGLLIAFIVFSIAVVVRRSRGESLPPTEMSRQLQ